MKKLLSILISCVMLATMLSVGVTASAKMTVSAAKIKLSNVSKGVKITWNKAKGAKKYELVRKASGAKKYSVIKKLNAKAKSFTDKKVKAGKKYTYALKAINGNVSAGSLSRSIVRLTAPKNIKYIKSKTTKTKSYTAYEPAKLKWSKVKGAKKYNIYRSEYNGKKWSAYKKIDWTKSNSSSEWFYLNSGKYTKFKVSAVNGKSESALSSASKKLMVLDDADVSVEKINGGVMVSWNDIGADKYMVYRSEDEGSFKLIKTLKGSDNIVYLDEKVEKGTYYSYYVIGVKDKVKSEKDEYAYNSSVYYDDCDYAIELGENDSDLFSNVVSLMDTMQGSYNKVTYKSSDENVLKVDVTTDDDGKKTVKFIGVSAGYATLTVKSTMDFGDETPETTATKFVIRVQDTPVYLARIKAGSRCSLSRLAVPKGLNELIELASNTLKLTSSDESVVKVNYKDSVPYLKGVKAGEAMISLSIDMSDKSESLIDYTLLKNFDTEFKVLVTE